MGLEPRAAAGTAQTAGCPAGLLLHAHLRRDRGTVRGGGGGGGSAWPWCPPPAAFRHDSRLATALVGGLGRAKVKAFDSRSDYGG